MISESLLHIALSLRIHLGSRSRPLVGGVGGDGGGGASVECPLLSFSLAPGLRIKSSQMILRLLSLRRPFFPVYFFALSFLIRLIQRKKQPPKRTVNSKKIEPKSGFVCSWISIRHLCEFSSDLWSVVSIFTKKKEHTHWPNTKPKEP